MAHVYLNTSTTVYRGSTNNSSHPGLFWMTKNVRIANYYANRSKGIVRAYRPARRLKLLKLSRESIRRLLSTNLFTPNIKHKLALLFGIGMTYRNQYDELVKLDNRFWKSHFQQKYKNKTPNWGSKGGRISVTSMNRALFTTIKNSIKHKYDGIYVPEMPTPHYPQGTFPSEYILFNPRENVENITTQINMNQARSNLNALLMAMNAKRQMRENSRLRAVTPENRGSKRLKTNGGKDSA